MSAEQRAAAKAEAERMWSDEDPALHRLDGMTIDIRRSYLVQRQAFEMGARWALETSEPDMQGLHS